MQVVNKTIPEIKDTDVTTSAIQEQKLVWTTETNYYQIKAGDNLRHDCSKIWRTVNRCRHGTIKGTAIIAGKTLNNL